MEVCFEVRLEKDRTSAMSNLMISTTDSTAFSGRSPSHAGRSIMEN